MDYKTIPTKALCSMAQRNMAQASSNALQAHSLISDEHCAKSTTARTIKVECIKFRQMINEAFAMIGVVRERAEKAERARLHQQKDK